HASLRRALGGFSYSYLFRSPGALVRRLASRGLEITSPDRAARYLRHIGYYRFSPPYAIPFQQGGPDHEFRSGTSFDDVLDLYVFDRKLRILVLDALERVEVAVRAAITTICQRSIMMLTGIRIQSISKIRVFTPTF